MGTRPARRIFSLLGLLFLVVVAIWGFRQFYNSSWWEDESVRLANDLDQIRAELEQKRFDRVQKLTKEILERDPDNDDAQLLLAEAYTKDGNLKRALEVYEHLLSRHEDSSDVRKIALQCAGEILLHQGVSNRAEEYFLEVLRIDPFFAEAHNRLAFKLGLEGRRWESMPHLFELVKLDQFSTLHLLLLANPRRNLIIDDYVERVTGSGETYPIVRLPEAKRFAEQGKPQSAWPIVKEILEYDSRQIETRMLEGELLLMEDRQGEFLRWSLSLDLAEEEHPACWLLRGRRCLELEDLKTAIRCFAEAFFRDPNNLPACKNLAQFLPRMDEDPEVVEYFARRVRFLEQLEQDADKLFDNQRNLPLVLGAYELCDQLERFWEAWGWLRVAIDIDPKNPTVLRELQLLEEHMVSDLPRTIIFKGNNQWNYKKYPLPQWYDPQDSSMTADSAISTASLIQFQDVAAELGIDFDYKIGERFEDINSGYFYMYQMAGAGVAAIDYDLDGYPDLYFAQGTDSCDSIGAPGDTDRLYRNLGGTRFRDVTELTGIQELAYSQGVNAGDVNNDGFPDLYVGNIGSNTLFLNNGDGTFTKSDDQRLQESGVWTASVVIADLDNDGIPDLYDVNYLVPESYRRLCVSEGGYHRACSPRIFPAERDRILRGLGDGSFEDVSDSLPEEADEGRGLGIIIADFFEHGQLQIFVANDTVGNNFYQLQSSPGTGSSLWTIRDEAMLRGVAFDTNGRSQACMGIAMADFDSNGRQDLFVTNFYADYNTLYIQDGKNEFFTDLSHSSNIASISYQMLGFGTQSLDADLDGKPDLFIANGHVDDFQHKNIPFRMAPQFIRNLGKARFEELPGSQLGEYFQRQLLGRAVAKLDFNRDMQEDLVVTHLESPPALLENQSATRGRPLVLSFIGARCSRDAVGTRITLEQLGRADSRQVTLGSGYFAANENQIVFPVFDETDLTLTVTWPSGEKNVYTSFQSETRYCIVEGREFAMVIP